MKKILISVLSFLLAAVAVLASPADPTPFKYTQPDGSVIVLQRHGDEHFHWTTDISGRVVVLGADGFYRPSGQSFSSMAAAAQKSRKNLHATWSSYDNPPATNFGDRKVLCILASFSDMNYSIENPKQHFQDMLNKEGYSENGAIGSVRDYYIDNSMNQYRPQFDVYGPVLLTNTSQYYDDKGPDVAILEAYELLKAQFDISDYDTDGDGAVDMVLFYYPGYNEAEGGPENTIWPHQSEGFFGMMGSKRFVRYFCTSELRGSSGTEPAAIGTTCHEFAHSLGLPDFYDTDYASSGGKNAFTTGDFDLMAAGNYNDAGRRPPYLNAVERNMLGWMDYPTGLTTSGNYSLQAVQNNEAYQFATSITGEYFVLESRNGNKWDSAIPSGLLLYHIDKSARIVGDGMTAGQLWDTNSINSYYGHPCFRILPTVEEPTYLNQYVFPGYSSVASFTPKAWDGNAAGVSFDNISHDGTKSSFTAVVSTHRTVFGRVTDTEGNPLQNVQVSLTPSTGAFTPAPSLLSGSVYCMTDADGNYSLELDDAATANQILRADKDGLVSSSFNLTISSLFTELDITLLHKGEGLPVGLSKYDSSLGMANWNFGVTQMAVGMHYSAEELAAENAVGALLKTVTIYSAATGSTEGESVYIVVDIDGETTLRREITGQYAQFSFITVDVSDAGIIIPSGKGINIGYGIDNIATGSYPFTSYGPSTVNNGGFYYCINFLSEHGWDSFNNGGNYYGAVVSAVLATTTDIEFSTLGVSYIKIEAGVPVVKVAAGKSLKSTTWYLDGAVEASPTATSALAAGTHTYMARLTYYDGTSERVYYEITVE